MARNGWEKMPVALPSGDLFPLMSAKDREEFAVTVFREAGGWERTVDILNKSDEYFMDWAKETVLKRLPKPAEVTHQIQHNVEALWDRLDEAEAAARPAKAQIVDTTAEVVDVEPES